MSRFLLIFLVIAAVGGCATYVPKPLHPAQSAVAFHSRNPNDPGLRVFLTRNGRPPPQWPLARWDLYDLTLLGLYENPTLALKRAQWRVAEAATITAGQRPNPGLRFLSEHHSLTAGGISPWTLGLSFDLPLETAGKRGDRISQARALADAARWAVGESAWQVRSRVRGAFLSYFATRRQERLLAEENSVRARLLSLLEQRQAAGEISAFDVNTARLALQRGRLGLAQARAAAASAHALLAQALGLPLRALDGMRFSFAGIDQTPDLGLLPSPAVQRAALLNRLDIRQALARYAAAEAQLKLEIARQYPDFHFGPGYSWDQGDNRWALGFSLTLPLFNQNQGPIAEAQARRAEAAAAFKLLQARVIGEIEQSTVDYRGAWRTWRTAETLLSAQKRHLHLVRARFAAGDADRVALTGARLALVTAARARLDALLATQTMLGKLEDAVQAPLIDPAPHHPPQNAGNPHP